MSALTEMLALMELYCQTGKRRDRRTGKCVPFDRAPTPRPRMAAARPQTHALKRTSQSVQRGRAPQLRDSVDENRKSPPGTRKTWANGQRVIKGMDNRWHADSNTPPPSKVSNTSTMIGASKERKSRRLNRTLRSLRRTGWSPV